MLFLWRERDTPKRYWSDLKHKMALESGVVQPFEKIVRLKLSKSGAILIYVPSSGRTPPEFKLIKEGLL